MSIRFSPARAAVASLLLSTALLAACGGGSDDPPPAPAPTASSVTPNTGSTAGGSGAVLAGANFVAGATVTVGGAAATGVTVTSDTAIAFTTPAHAAGAVDVVVRNPDAQSATMTGGYTYADPVNAVWVVPDLAGALSATQRTAFTGGNLYVNAHTAARTGGEIRGQLDNAGTAIRLASLDAAQEGGGITSTGFGAGILQVDTSAGPSLGKVRGFVITSGLVNITNAHVHRSPRPVPPNPPVPGGVVISLVPAGANKDMWVVPDNAPALSQELVTAFVAGELYYNVHTAVNTGGEIRGQLDKSGTFKLASLNAAQEPTVTSTALGAGIVAVNETTGAVAGFVVSTGFATNVINAHIHQGPRPVPPAPSVPGPVVRPMTFGPNLAVVPDDAAILDATGITQFQADLLYYNVHTTANGGGEIRGQLDKTGTVRVAAMDGAQERPTPVTTAAVGAGLVAVDGTSGQVSGFIVTRGLVSPTIAHIHQAARDDAAGPIVDLVKP